MGLDMYLMGKLYLSPFSEEEFAAPVILIDGNTGESKTYETKYFNNKALINYINDLFGFVNKKFDIGIKYLEFGLAYWRKANHIHRWFVENVQGGDDDCEEYHVSEEDIKRLLELCNAVAGNHDLAKELLPCKEGFFFGSSDYDDYYFHITDDTIRMLEKILEQLKDPRFAGMDMYYYSSW